MITLTVLFAAGMCVRRMLRRYKQKRADLTV